MKGSVLPSSNRASVLAIWREARPSSRLSRSRRVADSLETTEG
jgi:hypothetical protein